MTDNTATNDYEDDRRLDSVKLTWTVARTEVRRCTADLSLDEARGLFGLGGSPDDKVTARVFALLAQDRDVLACLPEDLDEDLEEGTPALAYVRYALVSFGDMKPQDFAEYVLGS
jgi:hypothetical protein